ncbi:hypothetical protein E2C01_068975 [Portunus trituberculatus]|uniref:Uncharacterized protein n=1 Tax=Portunus trituberculatus TaxID=210409 RepID=A0A5B7HXZ5_PORTR|nr:hypothetical protein [Portunus trituberculatus]
MSRPLLVSQPRDVNSAGPSPKDRVSQLGSMVADLIAKLDRCSPETVPRLIVGTSVALSALRVQDLKTVRLIDACLFFTNGLLSKALVPVAQCLSDIGQRKGKPVDAYLDGLNNCVRLLTSALCYLNQLRKEVARIHVNNSALAELCRWDCEVGTAELFPFDVVKKCEELHRARRLGRPSFRPYRSGGSRRTAASRQAPRRAPPPQHSRFQSKPF